ncbi:MAG: hypothetical protein IIB46_08000 [Nitrospinae bacterium]|nr:hypothetical protein [Nitrospinota bacterium]
MFTTITFLKAGETVDLVFLSGGWAISGFEEVTLQALSGPGAVDIITKTTHITTTGADAFTIADGSYLGQVKKVILIVDAGDAVLTPANALGWSTITFADPGDSVTLEWATGGWALIGQGGLTTGPLTA